MAKATTLSQLELNALKSASYTDGKVAELAENVANALEEVEGKEGKRGHGILKVTTAPTSYTTATGGKNPIKRMSLSTIKTQANVAEVLVGDQINYSYYLYHVYYLDATYAYMDSYVSIRGATGATGGTGSQGIQGEPGADGFSPEITTTPTENGVSLTITNKDSFEMVTIYNGKDGENGSSAMIEVNETENGHDLTIHDARGSNTFTIKDGSDATVTSQSISNALGYTPADQADVDNLITALPYGGSKEWLDKNGDRTKHYQIDGYVWSYIDSTGWTKGAKQFIVVSNKSQMTNVGGTNYLLRSGNTGTVYNYRKASGDSETPVYPSLPTTANEGDVVAVGNRKYRASVTTGTAPAFTNLYNPSTMAVDTYLNKRISSSHGYSAQNGMFATPYISVATKANQAVTIRTKGVPNSVNATIDSYARILLYTAESTYVTGTQVKQPSSGGWTVTAEDDGVIAYTNTYTAAAKLLRVAFGMSSSTITAANMADVIITVNEPITYETTTVIDWVDIGEYIPPVEAEWYATSETYSVVDTLGTASSGAVVVLSTDGWEYSYLSGASWVATSKYTSPYLFIDATEVDSELSGTSENPVQNKAVKAAIDRNANDIYQLRNEIANIETGSGNAEVSIPSYWQTSVDEAITKVKAIQDVGGKDIVHFIHFSDMHYQSGRTNYTNNIGLISKKLMDELNIPLVVGTGDITESGTASSSEMIDSDVTDAFATFEIVGFENLLYCKGNHDGAWGASATYGTNYAMIQHPTKLWNRLYRWQAEDFRRVFSEDGSYYYIDNIPQKVRYIVLNSHWADYSSITDMDYNAQSTAYNTQKNINYGDEQAEWLATKALDFNGEKGWTVIVFTHAPMWNKHNGVARNYMAVQYAGTNNASTIRSILIGFYNKNASVTYKTGAAADYSGVDESNTVAGVFCGHCHTDIATKYDESGNGTSFPFPIVSITSAGNANSSYEEGFGYPVTTRTLGTDTETAFDIVCINKKTKTINTIRVGAGSDRVTNY